MPRVQWPDGIRARTANPTNSNISMSNVRNKKDGERNMKMDTDKYIEGNLYVSKNRKQCWFSSDELPPFPTGKTIKVKAHFEILPEKKIVVTGRTCGFGMTIEGNDDESFNDFCRNFPNQEIKITLSVVEPNETGK